MKRVLVLVLFVLLSRFTAFAQHENAVRLSSDSTRVSIDKIMKSDLGSLNDTIIVSYRNNDHWFVDALVGGGFYCAEQNRFSQSFISRTRPQGQIGIGKWFHPALAVRFGASAGQFEGDYLPIVWWNMYDQTDHKKIPDEALPYCITDEKGMKWFHRTFNYMQINVDLMYDFTRVFEKRIDTPFDLYLYMGPGFAFTFPSQGIYGTSSVSFRLGGQMDIHLTKKLGLKFQLEGTIAGEAFDGQINGTTSARNRTIEGFATAMVGLSYRFGKSHPDKYVKTNPVIVERTYNLMPVIVPIIQEYDEYKAPFVVRFYIDQYNIEPDQELNITKVGQYLQEHPGARLEMTGHADPETANHLYNQALSERRCASVLKYLDEHFNIDHSRIDVKPMGDTDSRFEEDFRWNRSVILTIIEED